MRISTADNSPAHQSAPPAGTAEQYVWESLVPRLVSPFKVAIIESLLRLGDPLTPALIRELFPEAPKLPLVRYHALYLLKGGVLEVLGWEARPDGEGQEPIYFFAQPPRE
jgi:hypothetical protein